MNAEERWKKLKKYIQDDVKMCQQEEKRLNEKGDQKNSREWYMAAETGRQILDEMARLEKEAK